MVEEEFDPTGMVDMSPVGIENQDLKNRNSQLTGALVGAGFPQDPNEQDHVHYKLETDKILERIEHFLKGDQVKFDNNGEYFSEPTKNILTLVQVDPKTKIKYYIQELTEAKKGSELMKEILVKIENAKGNEIDVRDVDSKRILKKLEKIGLKSEGYKYVSVLDEDKKPFNEYGVAELMRIISMYVTKETFLSYYNEERINEIMGDLGDALNNFLYCNYEKMGMDTKFKESKYTLICLNLLHTIESCYRRALGGNEQKNIMTKSFITQNQGMGGTNNIPVSPVIKKKWSPVKPSTW